MVKHNEIAYKKITSCAKIVEPKTLGSFYTIPNANTKTNLKRLQTLEEVGQEALQIEILLYNCIH
jgi:hypothetical protein